MTCQGLKLIVLVQDKMGAFAQGWRSLLRPETLRLRTLTNPHSPPQWRVNGSVSNSPAFARAFGCRAGDAMVRTDSLGAAVW